MPNLRREKHETPADPERDEHFHVYVHYDVKIDVKNWRKTTIFDLEGNDQRVLHPEVQKVGGTPGDRHRVIKYGMKDGDFDQDLLEPLQEDEPEKDDKESWAEELNEATSVRAGMKVLMEKHAAIYYSMGARIEPMLAARLGDIQARSSSSSRTSTWTSWSSTRPWKCKRAAEMQARRDASVSPELS